jgi:hypothetical protein
MNISIALARLFGAITTMKKTDAWHGGVTLF